MKKKTKIDGFDHYIKYEEMKYFYTENPLCKILMSGKYKNYQFYIMSMGTHPTAYVEIPKGHKLYEKDYNQICYMGIDINVHGGLTYSCSILGDIKEDSWFIGWDYAHYGDYYAMPFEFNPELESVICKKKWTTLEILEDVKRCIETLRKEEK